VVPKGPVGLLKSQVSVAAFAGDNAIPPIVTVRAVARATCLSATTEREARKNGQGFRPIYIQYNNIEKRHDEDGADVDGNANGNPITGWITPDDAELRECDGTGGKVTDADWKRIVAGRAVPTNYPPNEYGPQPCKPISRSRYEEDQARAYRFHTAAFVRQRITGWLAPIGRNLGVPRECIGVDENPNRNGGRSPKKIIGSPGFQIPRTSSRCENPLPLREYLKQKPTPKQYLVDASTIRGNGSPLGIIGYLAKDVEARAKQRLAQVGRRLYAQELAVKDRVAIEPLFEPTVQNYCVPVNTAATAITNKVEHIAGPKTLSRCFHDLRDCGWTCKNTMVAKPGVWEERLWHERYAYKNPLWMWKRRTPLDELDDTANVRRRMNALVVAVDNGVENGTIKYNNAVQLGGGVHRANRGDRHDVRTVRRTAGKSSA